jgi:ribosomal protein L35
MFATLLASAARGAARAAAAPPPPARAAADLRALLADLSLSLPSTRRAGAPRALSFAASVAAASSPPLAAAATLRPGRPLASLLGLAAARQPLPLLAPATAARAASTLTPPFVGGKMKPYSAYKRRFKTTATGKIKYMKPGHVHKRFNKGTRQLDTLSGSKIMHRTYQKVMQKLGFTRRSF